MLSWLGWGRTEFSGMLADLKPGFQGDIVYLSYTLFFTEGAKHVETVEVDRLDYFDMLEDADRLLIKDLVIEPTSTEEALKFFRKKGISVDASIIDHAAKSELRIFDSITIDKNSICIII